MAERLSYWSLILIGNKVVDHYLPVLFHFVFPLIKFPWKKIHVFKQFLLFFTPILLLLETWYDIIWWNEMFHWYKQLPGGVWVYFIQLVISRASSWASSLGGNSFAFWWYRLWLLAINHDFFRLFLYKAGGKRRSPKRLGSKDLT